jgi:hypothetical protein
MRICLGNPRTRALCEWLGKETDELVRIDIFREGVGARLDQLEKLLGRYDCEEIRERCSCNRR